MHKEFSDPGMVNIVFSQNFAEIRSNPCIPMLRISIDVIYDYIQSSSSFWTREVSINEVLQIVNKLPLRKASGLGKTPAYLFQAKMPATVKSSTHN